MTWDQGPNFIKETILLNKFLCWAFEWESATTQQCKINTQLINFPSQENKSSAANLLGTINTQTWQVQKGYAW